LTASEGREINAGPLASAAASSTSVGQRQGGLEFDSGIDDRPKNAPDSGGAEPPGRAARGGNEDRGFSPSVPAVPRGERGADDQFGPEREKLGE
jgi:hypothetical protein